MRVIHYQQVEAKPVTAEGARGAALREIFTAETGAPTFALRVFELAPGGCTPTHAHPWEHEVFILDGSGEVVTDQGPVPLSPGTAVFVAPGERHSFRAAPGGRLQFICVIPVNEGCCK